MFHTAYIGIGSNLGDRPENVKKALDILSEYKGVEVARVSHFYETESMAGDMPSSDPPYLNAAAKLTTELSARGLLSALLRAESAMGRPTPRPKGKPRTIDLDLLLYDDLIIDLPGLTLPHPGLEKRLFVLAPMCDIAPGLIHPVSEKTMHELKLACLKTNKGYVLRKRG